MIRQLQRLLLSACALALVLSLVACGGGSGGSDGAVDTPPGVTPAAVVENVQWFDAQRARNVPARIYSPAYEQDGKRYPLVLLSHGFGESMDSYEYLGIFLAENGFIVVSVDHEGSDASAIVDGKPVGISNPEHWMLRPQDLIFALDEALAGHQWLLDGRVDPERIGVIGHSLGSTTALTLAGLKINIPGQDDWQLADPRVKAVVAMSPQIGNALDPAGAATTGLHVGSWNDIQLPVLLLRGTADYGLSGDLRTDPALRELVFDGIPGKRTFDANIENAEHDAFTDTQPWYPAGERDPRHYGWIETAVLSFLQAYLNGDPAALADLKNKALDIETADAVHQRDKLNWNYDLTALDDFLSSQGVLSQVGPGVNVILWKDGDVIYRRSSGSFTGQQIVPLDTATEWISGAVMMGLVDDGVFGLDDPVGQYLPAFAGAKADISLRQLFSHTSGLPAQPAYDRDLNLSMAAAVSATADLVPVADPGSVLLPSGLDMQAAGYAAVLQTGMDWQSLFEHYIGNPLGMTSTDYYAFGATDNPSVAGGAESSMDDYMNFLIMMMNRGTFDGHTVLSRHAVDTILSSQSGNLPVLQNPWQNYAALTTPSPHSHYGIGAWLDTLDESSGEGIQISSGGALGSVAFIDRHRNLAGVFLAEQNNNTLDNMGQTVNPAIEQYFEMRRVLDGVLDEGVKNPYANGLYKADTGPLQVADENLVVLHDTVRNKDRQLRVRYPLQPGNYPLIVLSHYSGGSRLYYDPLVAHWVSHGYVVIQPDHADSPEDPGPDLMGVTAWSDRPLDVSFILDSLDVLESRIPGLAGKIDRSRIGVAGHYLGAHTAGLIGGMKLFVDPGAAAVSYRDPRVQAVMMLSPTGSGDEGLTTDSWADMNLPMFVMTGSYDPSVRTGNPPEWRTEPFLYAHPGDKYLVWLEKLASDYGGLVDDLPQDDVAKYVKTSTIAFWDAYLKVEPAARDFLTPSGLGVEGEADVVVTLR